MTYQTETYQFKTRIQEDNRPWESIPVFCEADFNSTMGAGTYAQVDILGNDPHKTVREIRYNAKGSLQGHYVAGHKRLTVFDQLPLPPTQTDSRKANSIEQMQQVARNQIQFKIWQLEERLQQLEDIKAQVESVVDWDSYERLIGNIDDQDNESLTALNILGNEIGTMRQGNYF